MVGLDFGARFFCFCGVGGGVSSPLLLLLVLARLVFFLLHRLESGAVSLLDDDGVCLEHARASASVGNARNFFASLRELNFLWCRLCPSVSLLHLDHSAVSNSALFPFFRTA
jgi:hypothetical protein